MSTEDILYVYIVKVNAFAIFRLANTYSGGDLYLASVSRSFDRPKTLTWRNRTRSTTYKALYGAS